MQRVAADQVHQHQVTDEHQDTASDNVEPAQPQAAPQDGVGDQRHERDDRKLLRPEHGAHCDASPEVKPAAVAPLTPVEQRERQRHEQCDDRIGVNAHRRGDVERNEREEERADRGGARSPEVPRECVDDADFGERAEEWPQVGREPVRPHTRSNNPAGMLNP